MTWGMRRSLVALPLVLVVAVGAAVAVVRLSDEGGDRLDVAVVGDSFAEQSGEQFKAMARERGWHVGVWAYGGTALCSWFDKLRELVEQKPRRLVLSFAGNDMDSCINPTDKLREPSVTAGAYRDDYEHVLGMYGDLDTAIYVVPPPVARDALPNSYAHAMREMYAALVADHPELVLIDIDAQLTPDDKFHLTLPCQSGEACQPDGTVVVRRDDGIHLTSAGGERYARAVIDALDATG